MAAINHISLASGSQYGDRLNNALRTFRTSFEELQHLLAVMNTMNDGSDFTALETPFGLEAGKGDELYGEVSSAIGKLTTDASVTNVNAALLQLFAMVG